uniref:CXXC motif containing zinc binding protein n=1 Tax=Caenorhabditis japonica TaxID=281687 RepID=A0A8R1ICJ2_CAEJA
MLEVPGSRGEANLVEKCKLCGRVNTLSILTDLFKSYKIEQNEKFQQIAVFDCRGLEPIDFDPRDEWTATSVETGSAFAEIDLSEKEWVDFDDKAMEAVEIGEMAVQFTTVRDPKKK